MKTKAILRATLALLAIAGVLVTTSGCKKDPPESLFDPTYVGGAQPKITSVTATTSGGLALVTVLTITGQNFGPDVTKNIVFFNATPGFIQEATATRIVVRVPNVVADTVWIKIAAFGAELFNDPYRYKVESASKAIGALGPTERPYAVTVDGQGNVYFSLVSVSAGNETGQGVKQVSPDGTKTNFATTGSGAVTYFTGMKVGPGGLLLGAAGTNVIRQMTGGNTDPTAWVTTPALGRTEKISDFDFDAGGNMWAAGGIQKIYRITAAKGLKIFPFLASSPKVIFRSVRVYSGYLYCAGLVDSTEGVWRSQIVSADSLGAPEKFFDYTAATQPNGPSIKALTFAQNGDMYLGTTSPEAILIVHPNKSVEGLYPGVPSPSSFSIAWGTAGDLYQAMQTTTAGGLVRINMLDQRSAPYYGRQ